MVRLNMHILNHLSDLGSNFNAPKDNLSLSISIEQFLSYGVVLISEYGNFL